MTYTVSSGTLNSTIPYHTVNYVNLLAYNTLGVQSDPVISVSEIDCIQRRIVDELLK